MKKGTWKVITFVIVLVAGLLMYQIFLKDGGVVKVAWNAIATPVNNVWENITGDEGAVLMGRWGTSDPTIDADGENIEDANDAAVD